MRYTSPLAQAVSNSLDTFVNLQMNQPTQAELDGLALKNDYYRSQIGNNAADTALKEQKFGAPSKMAAVVRDLLTPQETPRPSPGFVGPMPTQSIDASLRGGMPDLIGAGMEGDIAANLPQLFRMIAANGGASNEAVDRAMLGAGSQFADTREGFTTTEGNKISMNEADNRQLGANNAADNSTKWQVANLEEGGRMARRFDTPTNVGAGDTVFFTPGDPRNPNPGGITTGLPTLDTVRGGELQNIVDAGGLTDPTQVYPDGSNVARLLGGSNQGAAPKAQNWVTRDGKSFGRTFDGLTDASTGKPLPQGAFLANEKDLDPSKGMRFKTNPDGTTEMIMGDETGNSSAVDTSLQKQAIALQDFTDISKRVRGIASQDPTLFGTVGNGRRIAQDVAGQIDAVRQVFGGPQEFNRAYNMAANDLVNAGIKDPRIFDPNLSDIEKMATLMAYKGAAALAEQEGKGLSNEDFINFRNIIGDPTAWDSTQGSFIAGLDQIDALVNAKAQRTGENMTGGVQPPAPAGAGNAVDISADPDTMYEQLAPGTQYIGPDGVLRVK